MADTDFFRSDELPGRAAIGYLDVESPRTNVLHLPVLATGDGGIFTTVADMAAFWSALFAGRIVSTDWVAEMVRARTAPPGKEGYGLGFWLHPTTNVVNLEGYDAGQSFRSVHDREAEVTIHGDLEHHRGDVADHDSGGRHPRAVTLAIPATWPLA